MFTELIKKIHQRHDLTEDESIAVMTEIMDGRAAPAQIAGLLIGLSMKGERPTEIVGLVKAMRARSVPLSHSFDSVFDTCGTGGDGSQTFNVSSLAALTLAACGVRVAKHGNRSISSKCGSADLFEALGVNVNAPPEIVKHCLTETGIAFCYAPTFHPSMKHAGQVRRDLGIRTAFNLLGPLTNPAGASRQVIGVPRPEHTDLLVRALVMLGSKRAWVIHSSDGLDEISISGHTKVAECVSGCAHTFYIHPSDFGVRPAELKELQVSGLDESISVARNVLAGNHGAARDFVSVNASAGLLVSGVVKSLREGMRHVQRALDEGLVKKKLEELVRCSQGESLGIRSV